MLQHHVPHGFKVQLGCRQRAEGDAPDLDQFLSRLGQVSIVLWPGSNCFNDVVPFELVFEVAKVFASWWLRKPWLADEDDGVLRNASLEQKR